MRGTYPVEVKSGKIVLPQGFFSGLVERREEGCLLIIPEESSRVIILSQEDMEYAEIKEVEEVLIVGCIFWYEIWNQEKFKEFLEEMAGGRYESIAEDLDLEIDF